MSRSLTIGALALCAACAAPTAGARERSAGGPKGDFTECQVEQTRHVPVNIALIIDSSPSMQKEVEQVRVQTVAMINALARQGIDPRLAIVTSEDFLMPSDQLRERAHLVNGVVQSHAALAILVDRFDEYARSGNRSMGFSTGAPYHLIVVSDDAPAMSAETFMAQMNKNLGHPASLQPQFVFHAIVSPPPENGVKPAQEQRGPYYCRDSENVCDGDFGRAVCVGHVYAELATATNGVLLDICHDNWSDLFARLTTAVRTTVAAPCPEAPMPADMLVATPAEPANPPPMPDEPETIPI